MKRMILAVALGTAALGAVCAVPSFAGGSGTISASITAAAPCLTIGTSSVDFGTKPFGTASTPSEFGSPGNSSVASCVGTQQTILASGTDAHSAASNAAWLLSPASPCQANAYSLILAVDTAGGLYLTTSPATLTTIAGNSSHSLSLGGVMPCTGSSGAGERMNFDYVLTATL
jgi:hypothetical protein